MHGKYPEILNDEVVGKQATELFADAQKLLKQILHEKLLKAKAIFGLFPANTVDSDDIEIKHISNETDEIKNAKTFKCLTLRQQLQKRDELPNFALSDFIAPKDSGIQDYMGAFAFAQDLAHKNWLMNLKRTTTIIIL